MSVWPIRALLRRALSARDRLYVVVDAARDQELAFTARDRFGLKLETLFEGDLSPELDHVAPHLISVDAQSAYLDLFEEHLGRSAGILLVSEAKTKPVRAHLRKIFVVTDEEGEELFFRYYDPRVLRVYLPTCTASEASEFFGPIRRIWVESQTPGVMLVCAPDRTGVRIDDRPLKTGDRATVAGQSSP